MSVTLQLDQETQRYLEDLVRDGRYASPSDAVAAAIARLRLDPADRLDEKDWAAIAESEAQIRAGKVRDFADVAAELRRKYLK